MSSVIDWTVSRLSADMPPWHASQPPRKATRSVDRVPPLLMAEGRGMTTTEIAEALGVSRDSINIACRVLTESGVLKRCKGPLAGNNHRVPIWRLK